MTIQRFETEFAVRSGKVDGAIQFSWIKRTVDIVLSLALMPILAFAAAFLMIANIFNLRSMLFVQERVGERGALFKMYKFRTMTGQGCEKNPKFATQELNRITRLGRFLRATRIDELPQIVNVLKGEMSIVGPRPEQVAFYDKYEASIPGYARRQTVRPGITGLAQLKYGYTSDEAGTVRKLKWDLEYIDRQSLRMEIYIVWNTFVFVIGRLLFLPVRPSL